MSTRDDVATIAAALDQTARRWLATGATAVRASLWALCALAAGTGLLALLAGIAAWGTAPGVAVVLVAVSGPAIVLPLWVARRGAGLTRAVGDPGEVVAEAKDLLGRAADSPELRAMAGRARAGDAIAAGRRLRRLRGTAKLRAAFGSLRTVSAIVGLADPDPVRHRLLLPLTPERLRSLWLAITLGLWWWLAAAVVATAAILSALIALVS